MIELEIYRGDGIIISVNGKQMYFEQEFLWDGYDRLVRER